MKNKLPEYILWDFDGVLMDSMPVRNKGFYSVLKDYPITQVEELMDYHQLNGGLSRYHKFRYFFENIRKESVSEDIIQNLSNEFSSIMTDLLIDKHLLIRDSIQFVEKYCKQIPMHIVSGSDGDELRFLCQRLSIDTYFKSIHGSPIHKNELVKNLLGRYKYDATKVVLIGDSINDYHAAVSNNIFFWGYNNLELKSLSNLYINKFSEYINESLK